MMKSSHKIDAYVNTKIKESADTDRTVYSPINN